MGQKFLIDSNVAIDYLSQSLPAKGAEFVGGVLNDESIISFVTRIELLGYNTSKAEENFLMEFVKLSTVIGINEDIILETVALRKSTKLKTPDAIIAATAVINNLTLLSRNEKDFKNIAKLKLVNPHKL